MERGSRAITTAQFLSADGSRGATAYTGTTTTWDAAKKAVVQRSAEELFGEGPAAGGGGALETSNRSPLPHQMSGKQQLAALGIRQPLVSPFDDESRVTAASEPAPPASPSGRSQQRSYVGLDKTSLTHWLQDGEEARSPRGSLAKQRELVLDPEAGDSGSSAAQLDNICDSVSETVDAALEQLRQVQRSRSSANSSSSFSRTYSKGLARLTSIKAAVASAVGSNRGSRGGAEDASERVQGFEAAGGEWGSSGGSPRPGDDSNSSSSKSSTLSSLSKVFRRTPTKVASMPVLPYEGSSSSRPATPSSTTRLERTVPEAASGWAGNAHSTATSRSSQGGLSRQGSSAAVDSPGAGFDAQQQTPFATSIVSSSSSSKLSRAGSSALPGIATDAAAAGGSVNAGTGAPRVMNRQQSSRLGVRVGSGLAADTGEPAEQPRSPAPAAAETAAAAVSGGDGSTPARVFRKSMSMGVVAPASVASPSPPMTPRSRAMGLTIDVNSSSSSAAAAGPPEAPPSGSMSPLARARHALLSRGGERVQPLDGTSTPVPLAPASADASSSGGTWAVKSPRSALGRSGSGMKPWEVAADGPNAASSSPSNSMDSASAYQQSKLAPGRLTHATSAGDMSDELVGNRRVQVKGSLKRNVSFAPAGAAMPGSVPGGGEVYADA